MEKKIKLFKALASFQQEVPTIHKGTKGYGYSYADLPAIFEVINPLMAKHGLGFTQLLGDNSITTIIFHTESGESIESVMTIPDNVNLKGMNEFQVMGSAITYYRRYSLSAILGLVTDVDNDANGSQVAKPKVNVKPIIAKINATTSLAELKTIWTSLSKAEQNNTEILTAKDAKKNELNK